MMLRLILIAVVATCAVADTCDFQPYFQCERPSPRPGDRTGSPRPFSREPRDFSRGPHQMPPEFKCLQDAKCQMPTPPPRPSSRPTPNPSEKAAREQARQCYMNVIKSVKADIQTCVQKQVPGWKFPEPKSGPGKEKGGHDMGRDGHEGPGGEHDGHDDGERGGFGGPGGKEKGKEGGRRGIERLINISCTTPESKASAQACVKALPPRVKNQTEEANRSARQCEKRTTCLKSLTPACQQQFATIEQAKCSCANSTITANSAKIEASLKACRANLPTPSPRPVGKGEKHKEGGFKLHRLIKPFCHRDPCKPKPSSSEDED